MSAAVRIGARAGRALGRGFARRKRDLLLAAALVAIVLLGGCKKQTEPAREPSTEASAPATTALPAPETAPSPPPARPGPTARTPPPPVGDAIDTGALHERRDPTRLLRFYSAALHEGRWDLAARAWRSNSGVTADTLKSAYDRGSPPSLSVGKASQEGAAGSIYYEVPVTLRFGGEPPQQGTLTLRRVNDVPGATAEQLDWRIERSTIGASQ